MRPRYRDIWFAIGSLHHGYTEHNGEQRVPRRQPHVPGAGIAYASGKPVSESLDLFGAAGCGIPSDVVGPAAFRTEKGRA